MRVIIEVLKQKLMASWRLHNTASGTAFGSICDFVTY